jgi:hypothetical protein
VYDQTNSVNMVKFWESCLCQSIENSLTIFLTCWCLIFVLIFFDSLLIAVLTTPFFLFWLDCYVHTSPSVPYCLLHCHTYGYFQGSVLSPLLSFLPGYNVYDHWGIRDLQTKLDLHQRVRVPVQTLLLTFSDTVGKSVPFLDLHFSYFKLK